MQHHLSHHSVPLLFVSTANSLIQADIPLTTQWHHAVVFFVYLILISKHRQLKESHSGGWQVQAQSHLSHWGEKQELNGVMEKNSLSARDGVCETADVTELLMTQCWLFNMTDKQKQVSHVCETLTSLKLEIHRLLATLRRDRVFSQPRFPANLRPVVFCFWHFWSHRVKPCLADLYFCELHRAAPKMDLLWSGAEGANPASKWAVLTSGGLCHRSASSLPFLLPGKLTEQWEAIYSLRHRIQPHMADSWSAHSEHMLLWSVQLLLSLWKWGDHV